MTRNPNTPLADSPEALLRQIAERSMVDRLNRTYRRGHRHIITLRLLFLALVGGLVLAVAINSIGLMQPVCGDLGAERTVATIDQIIEAI